MKIPSTQGVNTVALTTNQRRMTSQRHMKALQERENDKTTARVSSTRSTKHELVELSNAQARWTYENVSTCLYITYVSTCIY